MHEPSRFNELKKKIGGISATSLSERLTELEARGVVKRSVYPESPPRVEYSLTDKGKELQRLLCRLADWVVKWDEAAKTPAALHQPMTATAK
jgi:DNA-binding HxlR family transcriptional regulator